MNSRNIYSGGKYFLRKILLNTIMQIKRYIVLMYIRKLEFFAKHLIIEKLFSNNVLLLEIQM